LDLFFGLLLSDSKRLGDIVDLQPVGTGMERNTKAQKDKKANKFSDIEVKKFNFFFFPLCRCGHCRLFFNVKITLAFKQLFLAMASCCRG